MKVLHTADWHLGSFRGPEENGVNLRAKDTLNCLDEMIKVAKKEKPDFVLVSGDIFHKAEVWQGRSHKEVLQARSIILELSACSSRVVVMRGTPNHDSLEAFEELVAHFEFIDNVDIITTPQVLRTDKADIAVLPGFDKGIFRAKCPSLSSQDENEVFTKELGNIVMGLKAQCEVGKPSILMSHYTVPGCNAESGQVMMLTQFEPILTRETLLAAEFDLVALGHIHRPQAVPNIPNCFYSGAINAMNFNDEGQERGFWIHEKMPFDWESKFYKTPYREFITFEFTDTDITALNFGHYDEVAMNYWGWNRAVEGKIVRILYSCSYENNKALNKAVLEQKLLEDGAFMVREILPLQVGQVADRNNMSNTVTPEENLRKYLAEKEYREEKIQELILKARPIIAEAEASISMAATTGAFEPVEIEVKNYRNYEEEKFNFSNISFCTINGQNGAGKSSLFMDAIIDCLYEESREGKSTSVKVPWLRNDEHARSGSIIFTFRIGEKMYRVTRTRARSGKITLNLSEFVDGEWENRSKERVDDTQEEIINVLGMDCLTFKSCALIMQDQYGLFLQSSKEDRMIILGNLLGLGVYQAMEKISLEKGKIFGAKTKDLKQEISIHKNSILGYGSPTTEMELLEKQLHNQEEKLAEKVAERDKYKLTLSYQQEAYERRNKLLVAIKTLETKRANAEQNKENQQHIVNSSQVILDSKLEIEAKVLEHNALVEQERTLATEATIFTSKQKELSDLQRQMHYEEVQLDDLKKKLEKEQIAKTALEVPVDEEEIKMKAAEYERYVELFRQMKELQTKWMEAKSERDRKVYVVDSKKTYINQELQKLSARKTDLLRRTELLQNSGCFNVDNAGCRFLADALDAKKQLPVIESEICTFKEEQEKILQELIEIVSGAEKNVESIGYKENLLLEYSTKVRLLANAPKQLKELENRTSQIALIQASIDNTKSNIVEAEKRLNMVKLKVTEAEAERDKYKKSFEEHLFVQDSISMLKVWLEKEKQIPLAEERKRIAMERLVELSQEICNMDVEIAEKKIEVEKEDRTVVGMEELTVLVHGLDAEINNINTMMKELQIDIGSLLQKAEQIEDLEDEIAILQRKQVEAAKETADYDILKGAFSQDGIPHQIIRSIMPKLTTTANTILGQMTGGKMGIEFKTEKFLKSNSKKEVVTLDIFIEEYGKSVLPYLSKSGGEKVKSSLAVILALAEIKSSSAGIQLGMLFIDEPPFLDGEGIQAYVDALETIQQRYAGIKIMAITHDPTMKARFPQSIDVVKTERGSKVIY